MIERRCLKKLVSLGAVIVTVICMCTPASAADTFTLGTGAGQSNTGTINVTASVHSDYTISLPATVTLREMDENGDEGEPDLFYGAECEVGVKGVLIGEKVTLVPNFVNGDGKYEFTMYEAEFENGNFVRYKPTPRDELTVIVTEDQTEWFPKNSTGLTAEQQEINKDDFVSSPVVMRTSNRAKVDKAYSGELTFNVKCTPLP